MKKYPSFDEYLADQSPKNRSIIRALRRFVKRVAPGLQESVKWGNGCWLHGRAPVAYVYAADHPDRYADFVEADGSLAGPGYSQAEAAGLPAQYRVPGVVIKPGVNAA